MLLLTYAVFTCAKAIGLQTTLDTQAQKKKTKKKYLSCIIQIRVILYIEQNDPGQNTNHFVNPELVPNPVLIF